jgi:hypothetical protein
LQNNLEINERWKRDRNRKSTIEMACVALTLDNKNIKLNTRWINWIEKYLHKGISKKLQYQSIQIKGLFEAQGKFRQIDSTRLRIRVLVQQCIITRQLEGQIKHL